MKNQILKATGLLSFVQALGVLVSVVRTKVTALLIGAAGIGLIGYFNQGVFLLSNVTGFGLSFSAVQRLSRLYERQLYVETQAYVAMLRSWTLLSAALGVFLCCLFAPFLSYIATGTWEQMWLWWQLSPAIGLTTFIGTETAILKATHRLKALAVTTGLSTLTTLSISIVIYWLVGIQGIVPVLVSCLLMQALFTLNVTSRIFPFRLNFRARFFRLVGKHLFRLGLGYVGAGLVGSGAELLVSTFLYRASSVEFLGLYSAGIVLIVSYVRLLFSAVEADYYPRLSTVAFEVDKANILANEQISVLALLISPCLIVLASLLPWLVPLLYSTEFVPIIPMVGCALLSMFFKAIYTPIAYLSLARAESRIYLLMEILYYAVFVCFVVGGFFLGRYLSADSASGTLLGIGVGITLANVYDFCAILFYYRHRYHFRFEAKVVRQCFYQGLLVVLGLLACCLPSVGLSLAFSLSFAMLSVSYSVVLLWNNRKEKLL